MIQRTYLLVAKGCEPLGLSVHLNGKLEPGVSINGMLIGATRKSALFKNRILGIHNQSLIFMIKAY